MPRAKRVTLPGFPKEFVFETRDDLDAYFDGDKITCLMCGLTFRQLEPHLKAVHYMSTDDYRERYGIPYTRGLCCSEKSQSASDYMKQYFDDNPEQVAFRRQQVDANRHRTMENGQRGKPEFWKTERKKFQPKDAYEFGRRVIEGRTIASVERDADMPTRTHITWMRKRDLDLDKWWREAVMVVAKPGLKASDRAKIRTETKHESAKLPAKPRVSH